MFYLYFIELFVRCQELLVLIVLFTFMLCYTFLKVVTIVFEKRLKKLREEKKLTQKDIAKYLGVSDRSVGYYENGQRMPPLDILEKIADYFDVSVDYLLGRTDMKNPSTPYKVPNYDLDENLEKLINVSQNLSPEQFQKLTDFLESLYTK